MTWELLLKMLDAFHLKFLKISNSGNGLRQCVLDG